MFPQRALCNIIYSREPSFVISVVFSQHCKSLFFHIHGNQNSQIIPNQPHLITLDIYTANSHDLALTYGWWVLYLLVMGFIHGMFPSIHGLFCHIVLVISHSLLKKGSKWLSVHCGDQRHLGCAVAPTKAQPCVPLISTMHGKPFLIALSRYQTQHCNEWCTNRLI